MYVDARRGNETIESWLPVKVGEGERRFTTRDRFAYVADRKSATAVKWTAGIVMYALVTAFLVAMIVLVRTDA